MDGVMLLPTQVPALRAYKNTFKYITYYMLFNNTFYIF
jgi:hypothetical protein